jgi:hypothetical protein
VLPAIGDFVKPLSHLAIHVCQIGERAQRPEVAPKITDRTFDLSFLPGRRYVTGTREEAISRAKARKRG